MFSSQPPRGGSQSFVTPVPRSWGHHKSSFILKDILNIGLNHRVKREAAEKEDVLQTIGVRSERQTGQLCVLEVSLQDFHC